MKVLEFRRVADDTSEDGYDRSFADHPISLNEARGDQADTWTPRDALIKMLRDMDSGAIKPEGLCICYTEEDGAVVNYSNATKNPTQLVGMLNICANRAVIEGILLP